MDFFKGIVLDGPLGKVEYHAIRGKFKVRGDPHIHLFLWLMDTPLLSEDNIDQYIFFVDIKKAYCQKETLIHSYLNWWHHISSFLFKILL